MPQEGLSVKKQGLFYRLRSVRLLSFLVSFSVICICFLSLGAFNQTLATNYYVDSSITDTNPASATPDCTNYNTSTFTCSGGSASAYKTIADINAGSFSSDDQVLFRKGQTWREQLTVPSSGTSGHPITFGAFGSGANPIINGSNIFSSWSSQAAVPGGETDGIFVADAEENNLSEWTGTMYAGSNTISTSTSSKNNGAYGFQINYDGANANAGVYKTISASSDVYFRTYFKLSSNLATTANGTLVFMQFKNASNSVRARLTFNTGSGFQIGGELMVPYTALTSTSGGYADGNWHYIEGHYVNNATTGGFAYYVDGTLIGSDFTKNTSGGGDIVRIEYGDLESSKILSTGTWYFDDAKVANTGPIGAYNGTPATPDCYYASYTTQPKQTFRDSSRLSRVNSLSALTSGTWYDDTLGSKIYIYDNPTGHTIEASQRNYGIYINEKII